MRPIILLITEKDSTLASLYEVIKTVMKYQVIKAPLDDAMRIAATHQVDITLIDMINGGRNSFAMIENLKNNYPHMPIITLVPYADVDVVEEALAIGADDFLSQPVPLERLKTTLKNTLRMGKMLNKNGKQQQNWCLHENSNQMKSLYEIEKETIVFAINHCQGCITKAARALRIGRSTLYRKIQEMDIQSYISRENQMTRPITEISLAARS